MTTHVFVIAGEVCGGKWVTRWLQSNGLFVTHRSWPHGPDDIGPRRNPTSDIAEWVKQYPHGHVIALVRDPAFVELSAIRNGSVPPVEAARHVLDALGHAATVAAPVRVLVYEALVYRPVLVTRALGAWLGRQLKAPTDTVDGDVKWEGIA